ncbi:696bcd31-f2ba-463a-8b3c-dadc9bf90e82 [Thermothielavioides terrestris]|uniref:696bcd31-f2ba-463a-8b3c-dadc9bf90e82 n=2 Tax=Thermothielavioides terrestris TaxID=2587410 RepID=A0A3S4BM56_9PEZI|nr:696bcd31-f2ba-463a-8b3c-dadc9bf90e82 [Thermothielavioides terrestris]
MSASSDSPSNPQDPNRQPQTGLWAGHAEYIKGAAESTIGSLTGSESWRASGAQDKARARAALQTALEGRDPAKTGYGRAEELAGRLTGCEGMRQEGAAS